MAELSHRRWGGGRGFCKAENLEKILVGEVGTYFSVQ